VHIIILFLIINNIYNFDHNEKNEEKNGISIY